jgi:Cytochrome bd terminal oxidase subunit I
VDALTADRIQFAFTMVFHYLFPQLTMGLALLILILKTIALRTANEEYHQAARFWARIFAINFAMGVVTGIPMEFQFGTNWAAFSRSAGGVIGQTLAMEGVFAFFLESSFLGLFLFGEKRLGPRLHWAAAFLVFLGSCSPKVCTTATGQPAVREDTQWWRNLAGHARALLNLAAQQSKGRVNDTALARLNPRLLFPAAGLRQARREVASFLVYGMELWLRLFQVRPHATYNSRRKRIEAKISGMPPLPAALALQIMLVLTRWSGIAICSGCGKLFSPSRRPNPNRNAYCKRCGVRAAWREAQTRRRERKLTQRGNRRTSQI